MWKKFVDIPLFVFLLFSIFYLLKNVFFNENTNYKSVKEYRQSIENLKELVKKEKQKNKNLSEALAFVENNPQMALKLFIRDYLWKLEKGESLYLKNTKGE